MRRSGFTIIELVMALILVGALVAVASPSLVRSFRRTASRAAMDEFISTHSLARAVAVRFGRTAELHINATSDRFWVEVDTSSTGGAKARIGGLKDVGEMGVSLESDRALLCFDSRGLPTTLGSCEAANATLVFTAAGKVDTVQVTALGRVLR